MPAVVEVGVRALAQGVYQAPFTPEAAAVKVMDPAPVLTASPPAPVKVAATGVAPELPMSSCPLVRAVAVRGEVPPPMMMAFWVKEVAPVPPLTTDRVEVAPSFSPAPAPKM